MSKIHFMTPCYGGNITEACFNSYLQWTAFAVKEKVSFDLDTLANESNVNKARNSCVAKFLAGDATHLMFVDADIQWNTEGIIKLMSHDVDIVGGIYPQKTLPPRMVVNTIKTGKRQGNLLEVGTIGTGFMLIKRGVFEKMIECGAAKYKDVGGIAYDFYNCTIDSNGEYLTEDWSFCRRWRQLGGTVYADTTVALAHTGYHKFMPDLGAINNGNN